MINYRGYYEYTECPLAVTGRTLSANSPAFHTMEEWVWLEEALRTIEIKGSLSLGLKSATYNKTYFSPKTNVLQIFPDRSRLLKARDEMNAIRAREIIKSVSTGLHTRVDGFQVFGGSPQRPIESASVFQSHITKGAMNGAIGGNIDIVGSLSSLWNLQNAAAYMADGSGVIDTNAFQLGGGSLSSIFNGSTQWKRNGANSSSPERERLSGVFEGEPFLYTNSTTGLVEYSAHFYFRVAYSDPDIGTVDYTYSEEPVNMYYQFPYRPWNYNKNGIDTSSYAYLIVIPVYSVWQNSVWKIRTEGSSVWNVVHGEKGNYASYCSGGLYEATSDSSRITINVGSVKNIGDQICKLTLLENRTQYSPRINYGTIAEKKKIGNQWYVAPDWVVLRFVGYGRLLN